MAVGGLLHGQGSFWGGAIGRNPTDRGKAGSKKSILVDAAGGPLSVAVAGANVHDTKLLRPTLESIVVARPEGTQNLCLDKGYDNPTGHGTVAAFQYCPHIRRIGEEKLDRWGEQTFPARRWVVERTLSWLSKCRAILVRYDKKASTWASSVGLRPALVPPSAPYCFEIVSKALGQITQTFSNPCAALDSNSAQIRPASIVFPVPTSSAIRSR